MKISEYPLHPTPGPGFEPHRRPYVVSLSKNINPSLVLVQPRKTRSYITERLLMGRKESNQTDRQSELIYQKKYHILFKFSLKWHFLTASEGTVILLQYEDFLWDINASLHYSLHLVTHLWIVKGFKYQNTNTGSYRLAVVLKAIFHQCGSSP